jgi:hypothetical protein
MKPPVRLSNVSQQFAETTLRAELHPNVSGTLQPGCHAGEFMNARKGTVNI